MGIEPINRPHGRPARFEDVSGHQTRSVPVIQIF